MLPINGRPFAAYLVEMLRAQGFDRIVFLLGYLPEATIQYFGDSAEYLVTPPDWQTGQRLRHSEPMLDAEFLLCYGDNYWPARIHRMLQHWREHDSVGQMTVYSNEDRYSKANVAVDGLGFVSQYAGAAELKEVDLGFVLLKREALRLLPDGAVGLDVLYKQLVARRTLAAYPTSHRYYGVGTPERFELTQRFLTKQSTVILDRDGVLNQRPALGEYVRSWEEWSWLEGAPQSLRLLKESGHRVLIASNQPGVARGALTGESLAGIDQRMKGEAQQAGGDIEASYYCRHGWDEGCCCRKPKPGMLLQAQRDYHLDLSKTWFIGDDPQDAEAAEAAGCLYDEVTPGRSLFQVANDIVKGHQPAWVNEFL
jgi:D-glycero-D-manno-heptose 1,7-bisphosphate phosphatase